MSVMLGLGKVDLALLTDDGVSIRSFPFVDAERATFSTFSFFIIIFIFSSLEIGVLAQGSDCNGETVRWPAAHY